MKIVNKNIKKKSIPEEDILKAAAVVFARNGYRASTVDEIAREAHISKPTLYIKIKSKESLIVQLIEKIFKTIDSFVLEAAALEQYPVDRIKHFVEKDLNYFKSNPENFILILTERKLLKPDEYQTYHKIALEKYLHHIHIIAKYLILPGIRASNFRNLGAQKMAFILSGFIISTVWRHLLGEFIGINQESLHREVDSIMKIFLDGVVKRETK